MRSIPLRPPRRPPRPPPRPPVRRDRHRDAGADARRLDRRVLHRRRRAARSRSAIPRVAAARLDSRSGAPHVVALSDAARQRAPFRRVAQPRDVVRVDGGARLAHDRTSPAPASRSRLSILRASGTLFDVLQTPLAIGRALTRDRRAAGPAAVAADQPAALARAIRRRSRGARAHSLTLDGNPHTIVGVLPRGFELPALRGARRIRRRSPSRVRRGRAAASRISLDRSTGWGSSTIRVIARLQPGVALDQARAELERAAAAPSPRSRARETREPADASRLRSRRSTRSIVRPRAPRAAAPARRHRRAAC